MKVKELITALLECDMNCNVELKTINTDKNGCPHVYNIISVDPTLVSTFPSKEFSIRLLFKNYDFEMEEWMPQYEGKWVAESEDQNGQS